MNVGSAVCEGGGCLVCDNNPASIMKSAFIETMSDTRIWSGGTSLFFYLQFVAPVNSELARNDYEYITGYRSIYNHNKFHLF
jgi:hypothetical protein